MKVFILQIVCSCICIFGFGQTTYYSISSGDAAVNTNWEDGSGNNPSPSLGVNNIFIIQNGDTMTVLSDPFNIGSGSGKLYIENGGTFITSGSGNVNASYILIETGGILRHEGSATNYNISELEIYSGGIYYHNVSSSSILGSTCKFANSTNSGNGNGTVIIENQNSAALSSGITWGNLEINLQTDPGNKVHASGNLKDIEGDLTISNTQGQQYVLNTTQSDTHNIGGDLIVNGGTLVLKNNSNNIEFYIGGNLEVNADTLYIVDGPGNVTVNVNGNLNFLSGNTFLADASGECFLNIQGDLTFSNNIYERYSNIAYINASGNSTQVFNNNATFGTGDICFGINSSAKVDFGTSDLSGFDSLDTQAGATIITAHTDGMDGLIPVGMDVMGLNNTTNYEFNSTTQDQITGFSDHSISQAGEIIISNTFGTVTQNGSNFSMTLFGDVKIEAGATYKIPDENNFDLQDTYDLALAANATIITEDEQGLADTISNASFKNFNSISLTPTSTVVYARMGSQDISYSYFGNLTLSGSHSKSPSANLTVVGDLEISANAILDLSSYSTSLLGDLHVLNSATINGTKKIALTGIDQQDFNIGNSSFQLNKLEISNANGLNLNNDLAVDTIIFNNGIITSINNSRIIFPNDGLVSGASDVSHVNGPVIKLGNSDFSFPTGDGEKWRRVDVKNMNNNSDTFTVEYFRQTPVDNQNFKNGDTIDHISSVEYWEIDDGSGTVTTNLTLYYTTGVNDPEDLIIVHYNGSEWENLGQDDASNGLITVNNISSFSPFTFGSTGGGNPLPITLTSYDAKAKGKAVLLEWSTAMEENNEYFTIERSYDGIEFDPVIRINGAGNSSEPSNYHYMDIPPNSGIVYYRLKQSDFNGHFTYSHIVQVELNNAAASFSIHPNPTQGYVIIDCHQENITLVKVEIRDILGKVCQSAVLTTPSGKMDITSLSAGYYQVVLSFSQQKKTLPLIIQ